MIFNRCVLRLGLFLFAFFLTSKAYTKNLVVINEENWRDILTGEWMIEFQAPWCPACRDLKKAWDAFADWSEDLNAHVAEIDVTTSPGLSGRFLVTALPTIYHVKDGVFRVYSGSRDREDFISFIEDKKWSTVNPIPAWKHPDTYQMTVVSYFFKISMSVRDLHNYMVEKQGIPSWGSYAIFGLTTLILGCILGFLIVYMIDYIFPTSAPLDPAGSPSSAKDQSASSTTTSRANKEKANKKGGKKQVNDSSTSQKSKKSDKDSNSEAEKSSSGRRSANSNSEGDISGAEENQPRLRKKMANGTPDGKK